MIGAGSLLMAVLPTYASVGTCSPRPCSCWPGSCRASRSAVAVLALFGLVVYLRLPETAHRPLD